MVVPTFQFLMKPTVYKAELCANKVVSDSLELVDFVIRLVNSFPDLLDGQVKFFFLRNSNYRITAKQIAGFNS